MFYPQTNGPETSRHMVTVFGGYNHRNRISDGLRTSSRTGTPPVEWFDEENLSVDQYPMMAPARMPTRVSNTSQKCGVFTFTGIDANDHLAYVQAVPIVGPPPTTLYYLQVDNTVTNLQLAKSEKSFVQFGTYLLIFPDKKWINVNDLTEYGDIEGYYKTDVAPAVTLCDKNGTQYSGYTTSSTPPASPSDGDLWLDTSEDIHVLKRFSTSNAMWVSIPTTYLKITDTTLRDIPSFSGMAVGDGVTFSGFAAAGTGIEAQVAALNGSHIIQGIGSKYFIIIGMVDQAFTNDAKVEVERTVPDMDYVIECNNRLWGCKFGVVGGQNINELYCSALGSFKNWEVYEGLSTDSWRASVGAAGAWTGAVNYNGYPTFFKERSIQRIYISSTGAHQVFATEADGVAVGSSKSLVIINGVLYYLSHFGVMAYTGTYPTKISEAIPYHLSNGVAGALDQRYVLSAEKDGLVDQYVTFIFDSETRIWHKVSPHRPINYSPLHHQLCYETYYTIAAQTGIWEVGTVGWDTDTTYDDWFAESGVIGLNFEDNKYLSRFIFRINLAANSWCEFYVQYDSDGIWHKEGRLQEKGLQSFILPVQPRRCDHLKYKLVGHGDFILYSISATLEVGSDE